MVAEGEPPLMGRSVEPSREVAPSRKVRAEGVVADHVGAAFDDLVKLHEELREAPLEVLKEARGQRRHFLAQAGRHVEEVVPLVAQGAQEVADRADVVLGQIGDKTRDQRMSEWCRPPRVASPCDTCRDSRQTRGSWLPSSLRAGSPFERFARGQPARGAAGRARGSRSDRTRLEDRRAGGLAARSKGAEPQKTETACRKEVLALVRSPASAGDSPSSTVECDHPRDEVERLLLAISVQGAEAGPVLDDVSLAFHPLTAAERIQRQVSAS